MPQVIEPDGRVGCPALKLAGGRGLKPPQHRTNLVGTDEEPAVSQRNRSIICYPLASACVEIPFRSRWPASTEIPKQPHHANHEERYS